MKAMSIIDGSREIFSDILGGEFGGTIFTSSATEANNLALRGVVKKYTHRSGISDAAFPARIIISGSEHDSVHNVAERMSQEGCEIVHLPTKKDGRTDLSHLDEAINGRTVMVSLIYVNNETGAVNDIKKAAKMISEYRGGGAYPLLHVDASQAFRYYDCSFPFLGADMITLSSHKIGGPKGAGALCFRQENTLKMIEPIIIGGGQEFGMRSGTENVPAIAGFSAALNESFDIREKESRRLYEIKKIIAEGVVRIFPKAKINGPSPEKGSPHILNIWIPGKRAEDVLIAVDMAGGAISYGSACSVRAFKPSRVLIDMGLSEDRVRESVRISLGRETTKGDAKGLLNIFKNLNI